MLIVVLAFVMLDFFFFFFEMSYVRPLAFEVLKEMLVPKLFGEGVIIARWKSISKQK